MIPREVQDRQRRHQWDANAPHLFGNLRCDSLMARSATQAVETPMADSGGKKVKGSSKQSGEANRKEAAQTSGTEAQERSGGPVRGPTRKGRGAAAKGPPDHAEQIAEDAFVDLWFTEDHREAEKAFAEKRSPNFKGK